MLISIFPADVIGRRCKKGVPHMKVKCIVCQRSAEIPNALLDIVIEVTEETGHSMTFACSECLITDTEKLAKCFVDKVLYKNADQN
jgi:hypothetical protein